MESEASVRAVKVVQRSILPWARRSRLRSSFLRIVRSFLAPLLVWYVYRANLAALFALKFLMTYKHYKYIIPIQIVLDLLSVPEPGLLMATNSSLSACLKFLNANMTTVMLSRVL